MTWRPFQTDRGRAVHTSASGVNTSTPMLSPTHQVHQLNRALSSGTRLRRVKVPTPTLALTRQATGPPSASIQTTSISWMSRLV